MGRAIVHDAKRLPFSCQRGMPKFQACAESQKELKHEVADCVCGNNGRCWANGNSVPSESAILLSNYASDSRDSILPGSKWYLSSVPPVRYRFTSVFSE